MAGTLFKKIGILLLALIVGLGNAANILVMVPMPFKSHTMNSQPIFKELAKRGHNVTVVSPFPQKTPVPNLTDIVVPNFLEELSKQITSPGILLNKGLFSHLTSLWHFGLDCVTRSLQFEQVQRLIQDTDSRFDLIIAEVWFLQEPFIAFGHKFKAPVIGIMQSYFFPKTAFLNGNHYTTAFSKFNDRMTFMERAINFAFQYWDIVVGNLYYLNKQDALMREYFKYPGSENLPPIEDLLRNISLTLIEQNTAIGYPEPLQKNVIPYGGINVQDVQQLPEDLKTILDNAKTGVIYLSFGSYFCVTVLEPFMQDAILSALGKLKYKVLLKLDDPSLLQNYSSKNIVVRNWFPQSAVLAHPNCKLFITHGGLHGLMEAVYHAVPMIAIPLRGDQNYNAKFIVNEGIGYSLDKNTITTELLLETVDRVLHNPTYREKIKERSAIFKDQPMPTMDHVIYWIEYVIRHRGAAHLRPAVLDLHWYQYLMLDVIAFGIFMVCVILYILKKILLLLIRCVKAVLYGDKVSKKKDVSHKMTYKRKSKKNNL